MVDTSVKRESTASDCFRLFSHSLCFKRGLQKPQGGATVAYYHLYTGYGFSFDLSSMYISNLKVCAFILKPKNEMTHLFLIPTMMATKQLPV